MLQVPNNIKELLHQDHCEKNIRIHFPNGERSDICNNLIVKDTVSFTESLCSQNTLKFGLCESPIFECEVVGVGNIKGATIEVFCEIHCEPTTEGAVFRPDLGYHVYPIPYGTFVVDSSKRQADMIHRKIIAYGGFSTNFDSLNEIQWVRDTYGQNSRYGVSAYQPNIFKINMMLLGLKNLFADVTKTDLTVRNNNAIKMLDFYLSNNVPMAERYTIFQVRCKAFGLPLDSGTSLYDLDQLYYCDMPETSKTPLEMFDEIRRSNNFVPSALETLFGRNGSKWTGCGLGLIWENITPDTYRHTIENPITKFQTGHYIYPYQYIAGYEQGMCHPMSSDYIYTPCILVPYSIIVSTKQYIGQTDQIGNNPVEVRFRDPDAISVYKIESSDFPTDRINVARDITNGEQAYGYIRENTTYYCYDASKIDYIKLLEATMEMQGQFGILTRDNLFDMLNIKRQFGLDPASNLYPGTALYPQSVTGGKIYPDDYQSCWYDDEYTKPFGLITCQYKNTDNEDCTFTLYLTGFDADSDVSSYQVYSLENNEIIKGGLWTEAQIQAICETIADNIEGVSYMAVDFVGRGLPYVEAGDTFEILTKRNDSITTIVLNRTLTGEQTLTDSYKSV